jgi:hypothetical protein
MAMAMAMAMAMVVTRIMRSAKPGFQYRKIALFIVTVFVSVSAGSNAIGLVSSSSRPELAIGHVGVFGSSGGLLADLRLASLPSFLTGDEIVVISKASLTSGPLDSRALRLLGLKAASQGNSNQATVLYDLSQRVTRRDVLTQTVLIQEAVNQERLQAALHHYDVGMLTSYNVRPIFLPILANGLEDGQIRKALRPYIKSGRNWLPDMIKFVVDGDQNADFLAAAIIEAGGLPANEEIYRGGEASILQALTRTKKFSVIPLFFSAIPNAPVEILHSAAITPDSTNELFQPVSWRFSDDISASAQLEAIDNGPNLAVTFVLNEGTSGIVAQKLIFLKEGRYQFTSNLRSMTLNAGISAGWQVVCADGGKTVAENEDSSVQPLKSSVLIRVTSTCPSIHLKLFVANGDGNGNAELFVGRPVFHRLSS